jgi:hypothetical protein
MRPIPILGLGIQSGFPSVTAQERINCYLERQLDGEKSNIVAYGTPGKTLFAEFGDTPVRGGLSFGDYLYLVHRGNFYRVNNAGSIELVGAIGSTSGFVSMATNGLELFIADGTANAYYYTFSSNTLAASDSPALSTVCFLDGYIIGNEEGTGKYYWSDLYDASTWDALNFASAESNPDDLVAVFADQGAVMLFGTFTTEIVGNAGQEEQPFIRVGTPIEWGLVSKSSIAKLGDQVAFLARNRMGEAQVILMRGYSTQRISTHDIERIINNSGTLESATAFSYMINGHQFYQLNAAGKSFIYDLSTGVWSRVKANNIDNDRGNLGFNLINRIIVSDFENGNLYTVSDDVYDDNGDPLVMNITGSHIIKSQQKVSINELFVDMEVGVGATTGQGVNPQIVLEVSRDSGHTWGNPIWKSFGRIGEYLSRVSFFRLGRGYSFTFSLTISDPVKRCILGAWITHD